VNGDDGCRRVFARVAVPLIPVLPRVLWQGRSADSSWSLPWRECWAR